MPRVYYNPINKESMTILTTAEESNGLFSEMEVCLQTGGGNSFHYHQHFTEEFEAIDGVLGVSYRDTTLHLNKGEKITVPIRKTHRFFNPSQHAITFKVTLRPGQPGFENFIKALFGLVNENKTFGKNQIPINPFYAVILLHWGDTQVDNLLFTLCKPLTAIAYWLAKKIGIENRLLSTYCSK